jgi:hypothetical protein
MVKTMPDLVNHPPHYADRRYETIDVIEDAISSAPSDIVCGYLQGQALKYLLRMWLKGAPLQDARKAQWYINRLINHLEP